MRRWLKHQKGERYQCCNSCETMLKIFTQPDNVRLVKRKYLKNNCNNFFEIINISTASMLEKVYLTVENF